MYLNGFLVEILIDDKPLQEFTTPINSRMKTTTGPSYIIDECDGNKYESGLVTFAAVPQSGTRFSVGFSAEKASKDNVFVAELYVDGKHDHRCRKIHSTEYKKKEYFWDASRDNKCYFKFTKAKQADIVESVMGNNKQQITPANGGLGAVSVYFYKGKSVEERIIDPPEFTLDNNITIKDDETYDIMYTTSFDIDEGKGLCTIKVEKTDPLPIAALHLHYRPAIWLVSKGFNLSGIYHNDVDIGFNDETPFDKAVHPIIMKEVGELIRLEDSGSLRDVIPEVNEVVKLEMNSDVELDTYVKKESLDDEKVVIVLSDEDKDELDSRKFKKRRYKEIIEILDSDEEKDIIEIKKPRFHASKFISYS